MQLIGIFFFLGMMLEFSTLFAMISWLGAWTTLGLVVLGLVFGGVLMRHNLGVVKVMMAGQFLRGSMSFYDMMLPIRVPLAGLLLAMPTGFLSSLLGLLLLIPFKGKTLSQQTVQQQQKARFEQHGFQYSSHACHSQQNDDDVIEGEYTVKSKSSSAQSDVIEHQR